MIRVFIVDPDPGVARSLREMLDVEPNLKVVGEATDGPSAVRNVEKTNPHIVLMDASTGAGDGGKLAADIQAAPSNPVLIMTSEHNDLALIRKSMVLGARDHLVKPFPASELVTAIHTVFAASDVALHRRARIVGLLGCRGGAGNTTVSLSLAGAAARRGLRVAVVDGDLTLGDVSFLLNTRPELTWVQWSKDCGKGDMDPRKYLVRSQEGIDILSAPLSPAQAELVTVDCVSKMLNALRESHDLVIVDVPCSFNEISLELTEGVQDLYLLSDPTLSGLKNLRLIWDLLEQLNFPHEKRAVLLNRIRKQDRQVIKEAEKNYSGTLTLPFESGLERGWLRGETPARGMRRSSFSKQIGHLLDQMISTEGVD